MLAKTYNVLEIEDVERIISEFAGREVRIGEMKVELVDSLPVDVNWSYGVDVSNFGMIISVEVNGVNIVIDEEERKCPLQKYLPDGVFVPESRFFNFETKLFKSYSRHIREGNYYRS